MGEIGGGRGWRGRERGREGREEGREGKAGGRGRGGREGGEGGREGGEGNLLHLPHNFETIPSLIEAAKATEAVLQVCGQLLNYF